MRKLFLNFVLVDDSSPSAQSIRVDHVGLGAALGVEELAQRSDVLAGRNRTAQFHPVPLALGRGHAVYRKQLVIFPGGLTIAHGNTEPIVGRPVLALPVRMRTGNLLL